MSRTRTTVLVSILLILIVGAAFFFSDTGTASRSVTNRNAWGLFGLYEYLERTGWPVHAWRASFSELQSRKGTLIIACPTVRMFTRDDQSDLRSWLAKGNSLVILASGQKPGQPESSVYLMFDLLEMPIPRQPPPYFWPSWRRWQAAEAFMQPSESGLELGLRPAQSWIGMTGIGLDADEVWMSGLSNAVDVPRVVEVDGPGRVIVVNNVSMWANAWLDRPGNLENAETILRELTPAGGEIFFDEWHHGFGELTGTAKVSMIRSAELLLIHLVLLYLLAVVSLSRRFGGVMSEPPPIGSTVSRPLRALAQMHRQSGHQRAAGNVLLDMARRLAARDKSRPLDIPETFDAGERELLALARKIGRWQQSSVRGHGDERTST